MQELIKDVIVPSFGNSILNRFEDSAVLDIDAKNKRIAFTTDSFVVSPIFFPGGDIGKLAICGTINDLAMMGAKPKFLSAAVIIEEGFPKDLLRKIISSMQKTIKQANVKIVCGDTKVVNKGSCDKIFINTAGVGLIDEKVDISIFRVRAGDVIVVSGGIAEHGVCILSQREGIKFKSQLKSDCAALNSLVAEMLKWGKAVHAMRDPTRGGLSAVLNEVAEAANVGIEVLQDSVPVSSKVAAACEILGLDPLYLPCEGRLAAFLDEKKAKNILKAMRKHPLGKNARIIGRVVSGHRSQVNLKTITGAERILDMPIEEQMPRIC